MLATFPTQTELAGYEKPTKLQILPLRERPDYRLAKNAAGCSLVELIAVVIGGVKQIELAETVIGHYGGDMRRIYNAPVDELARLKGIGTVTAQRIKAALALGMHYVGAYSEKKTINSPADAANLVQYEMSTLEQEYLKVILLDTRSHVLDVVEVYHGSVNSAQVRTSEIFKEAVRRLATSLIVVHNHPSGDPTPSPDDVALTRVLVQAGKLLDIEVLDHLVIGQGGRWVSLKERGLGFGS